MRTAHSGVESRVGFSGAWTDPDTGLVYLRARDYDPATGQFLRVDPAVDSTRQPYAYAGNNPLQNTDPSGLDYANSAMAGPLGDFWALQAGILDGLSSGLSGAIFGSLNPNYYCMMRDHPEAAGVGETIGFVASLAVPLYGLAVTLPRQIMRASMFLAKELPAALRALKSLAGSLLRKEAFRSAEVATADVAKRGSALVPYYPANSGFAGAADTTFLYAGHKIDRFGGGPTSTFFSPQGTAAGARSLPPGVESQSLRTFEVLKPFSVQSGRVAPAFGQAGGGLQFNTPAGLGILLRRGILREVF